MPINIHFTIYDDGRLEATAFAQLLNRTETTARNAAIITTVRLANSIELAPQLTQLAVLRIATQPESFFWVDDIGAGSKIVWGAIIAGSIISVVLNNTIGEAIKEGFKQTKTYEMVVSSIPKIEQVFLEEFVKLFQADKHSPPDTALQLEPVAIRRDDDDVSTIEIKARQRRASPESG